jgi:hypothetical protein
MAAKKKAAKKDDTQPDQEEQPQEEQTQEQPQEEQTQEQTDQERFDQEQAQTVEPDPEQQAQTVESDPEQQAQPTEDESASEPGLEPYQPKRKPLQNADVDQHAEHEKRQAELDEERKMHNERTGPREDRASWGKTE